MPVLIQAKVNRSIGWAALRFAYNEQAKNAIKAHPGARWIDPDKSDFDDEISVYLKENFPGPKAWYVPSNLLPLLEKEPGFKFRIEYEDEPIAIEPPTELFEKLKPYQQVGVRECLSRSGFMLTYEPRVGKAQPLDAKVLTPSGWRRIGDLVIGDEIIDPDGGIAIVKGVFDQGTRAIYRVTSVDGASTECCDEHLWTVETPNDRTRGTIRTINTATIRASGVTNGPRGRNSKYFLPITKPVRFSRTKLPIDPYVMGALLGDGSFRGHAIEFTTSDKFLAREVDKRVRYEGVKLSWYGRYYYALVKNTHTYCNPFKEKIAKLGLIGCDSTRKFIPDVYLRASIKDRKLLLAGLLDTDGSTTDGVVTFCTTSERLKDQLIDLVGSLGGYVKPSPPRQTSYIYKGQKLKGKPSWILQVRVQFNPFLLPRKAKKFVPNRLARGIAKIEPTGEKPVRCISTTAKRQLYITDGYIVTHNTPTAITSICGMFASGIVDLAVVLYPNSVREEWQRQLDLWAGIKLESLESFQPLLTMEVNRLREVPYLVVGCHYEILGHREKCLARLVDGRRYVLVMDELHTAKSRRSARYRTARRLSLGTPILAEGEIPGEETKASATCVSRIGLTGTEMRNRPRDLFGPLDLIQPGQVGGYWSFAKVFAAAHQDDHGHWNDKGTSKPELLSARLKLCTHKVTRAEAAPWLPKMDRKSILCAVPEEMLKHYRKLENAYAARIKSALADDELSPENQAMLKEMDKATSAAKMDEAIKQCLMYLDLGKKVRISAHHHETIKLFVERFDSYFDDDHPLRCYPMHVAAGYNSPAERSDAIKRWKAAEGAALLVVNNLSTNVGIDLSEGKVLIMLEPEWVSVDQEQLELRGMDVHLGKTVEPPLVIYLFVRGTLDEDKVKAMLSKIRNIEEIVGKGTDTSDMAKAFRASGVVDEAELRLESNDRSVVAIALKALRERMLRGPDKREASLAAEMAAWENDSDESSSGEEDNE